MNYNTTDTATSNHLSTRSLVLIALMTAITCILAPQSIPIGISPVPITLTNLVLYVSIYILGWKKATISCGIYLLLGLIGLPVFSGFSGGLGKLAGPTGGYLIGFLFLTIISGILVERFSSNKLICGLAFVLGTAVCYLFGTIWLGQQMSLTFSAALAAGVIPYIPGDLCKIVIGILLGSALKKRLAGLQ